MNILFFRLLVFLWVACLPITASAEEPLASWNDRSAKQHILAFVSQVTDPNHPLFVPIEKRIAVFDNDGTLWLEKPFFVQAVFTQTRVAQMVQENPKLAEVTAFKVFLEKDPNYRKRLTKEELTGLIVSTHSGMSEDQFQVLLKEFFEKAKDSRFDQTYTSLVYQPMLELLEYLKVNNFKVYICTGGGIEFVRAFAEGVYGIPPEQVIGTPMEMEFTMTEGKPDFMRLNKFAAPFNDKANKPMYIQRVIGRPPIIAVGNSDGDIQMLKYAKGQKSGLALLVRHDDPVREYAYEEGAKEAHALAREHNWVVISMKDDFKHIFPKEKRDM